MFLDLDIVFCLSGIWAHPSPHRFRAPPVDFCSLFNTVVWFNVVLLMLHQSSCESHARFTLSHEQDSKILKLLQL